MKNTYIIALHNDWMPVLIKQRNGVCIAYIGKCYKNAYIFWSKKEAYEIRKKRYIERDEKFRNATEI